MTINSDAAGNSKNTDSSFNCCADMMKMMGSRLRGKDEKINFEEFCGKMSGFCREMMKGMKEKKPDREDSK